MEKQTKLLSMKPCGRMVNSQVLDCSRLVAQQRSAVARAADQRLRRTSAALQARHVDDTKMIGHDGSGTNQSFLSAILPFLMIQLEISDFKIIDEDLKIDGILFLGHRHIFFWGLCPNTTHLTLPGTCCLETAAVGGWNCGGGWQSIDVEVWLKIIETWMFGTLNLSFVAVQAASLWCS